MSTELRTHRTRRGRREIAMLGAICGDEVDVGAKWVVVGCRIQREEAGRHVIDGRCVQHDSGGAGMSVRSRHRRHQREPVRRIDHVCRQRIGDVEMKPDVADVEYQPARSAIRFALDAVKKHTCLLAGSATVTRFGTVWPAVRLRFDASGRP